MQTIHMNSRVAIKENAVTGEDLVTGGSGFIGRALCQLLSLQGRRITIFDRSRSSISIHTLQHLKGDIASFSDIAEAVKHKSRIFHLAGIRNREDTTCPGIDVSVNTIGTINTLEALRRYNDDAEFLFVSSSAVYGEPENILIDERTEPKPITLYGASKLAAEIHCDMYARKYGMKIVRIRPFNTYGTFHGSDLIPATIRRVIRGVPPLINGDGKQVRDFTYVGDLVRIMNLVISEPKAYGKVINVGHGKRITVLKAVELISTVFGQGKVLPPTFTGRSGGARGNICDTTLLGSMIGIVPATSIQTGLRTMKKEFDSLNRGNKDDVQLPS
jgi:UDP-glucose 4-epimerase